MDTAIPGFQYLVTNPERLGGKATIRCTRFSVSFVLACLAAGDLGDLDAFCATLADQALS